MLADEYDIEANFKELYQNFISFSGISLLNSDLKIQCLDDQ